MEAMREAKTREVAIVMDIDYRGDGRKKEKERGEMDFSGRKKLGNYGRRPPQDINTLRPNFRPSASCSVLVRSVWEKALLCAWTPEYYIRKSCCEECSGGRFGLVLPFLHVLSG